MFSFRKAAKSNYLIRFQLLGTWKTHINSSIYQICRHSNKTTPNSLSSYFSLCSILSYSFKLHSHPATSTTYYRHYTNAIIIIAIILWPFRNSNCTKCDCYPNSAPKTTKLLLRISFWWVFYAKNKTSANDYSTLCFVLLMVFHPTLGTEHVSVCDSTFTSFYLSFIHLVFHSFFFFLFSVGSSTFSICVCLFILPNTLIITFIASCFSS